MSFIVSCIQARREERLTTETAPRPGLRRPEPLELLRQRDALRLADPLGAGSQKTLEIRVAAPLAGVSPDRVHFARNVAPMSMTWS